MYNITIIRDVGVGMRGVEKMRGEGCRRYGNEVYGEFEG